MTNRHNLLDTHEAAEHLHVNYQTLKNWRFRGVGPGYWKLNGHKVVYQRDELDRWMRLNSVSPNAGGTSR